MERSPEREDVMTEATHACRRNDGIAGPRHGLEGLVRRVRQMLAARREQRIARAAFMRTTCLDDRTLEDIGVTRDEVEWAARLPLSVNASRALHARARARRAAEGEGRVSWHIISATPRTLARRANRIFESGSAR
jgi:uncharacterized protein YjiS (DUF1127 family)